MDRDGTRDGFDLALTRAVVDAVEIPVVASGGVGRLQDLVDGAPKALKENISKEDAAAIAKKFEGIATVEIK